MEGLDKLLQFQSEALKLRSYRQELLSANIANSDTPNYKAVDIDFAKELSSVQSTATARPTTPAAPNLLEIRQLYEVRRALELTALMRPVEVGPWNGDEWFITRGLEAGDRVVVDGVARLSPGAPVSVVASVVACSMTVNDLPPPCFAGLPDPAATAAPSAPSETMEKTIPSRRFMVIPFWGRICRTADATPRRPFGQAPPTRRYFELRRPW